jgi:hypothetical protein
MSSFFLYLQRLLKKALLNYYRRAQCNGASIIGTGPSESVSVAGRAWAYNKVYALTFYKNHISEHRRGNNYIMFTASYM